MRTPMNMQNKNRLGFTLIEVMLLLLVVSLIFASSTSVITRKHKLKPRRTVHGQYICYRNRDDGNLHEIMYSGRSMLRDRNQTLDPTFTQCSFEAPKAAPYLYVQVIGGGGAGGNANHSSSNYYYSSNYNTPSATINGTTESGIINLMKEEEDSPKVYGIIGGKGPTVEQIHSYKWKDKEFSVKAFQQILNDAGVKMFAFDTVGNAGGAGDVQVHYLKKSDYEKLDGEPDEVFHWYDSECSFSDSQGTSLGSPESCLAMLYKYNSTFPMPDGTKTKYSELDDYCQFRYPLYKNCPILQQAYIPRTYSIECPGAPGGTGGYLVTPVVNYQLEASFDLGKKMVLKQNTSNNSTYIDEKSPITSWDGTAAKLGKGVGCLGSGNNRNIDYNSLKKGMLLTTEKACGDAIPNAGCVDRNGNPIKNGFNTLINGNSYITSEYDYKYFTDTKEVCTPPVTDDEGNIIQEEQCHYENFTNLDNTINKILITTGTNSQGYYYIPDALYFDTYPEVTYNVAPNECQQEPGNPSSPLGTSGGKPAGFPFFLNDLGNIIAEGIHFCYGGICNYYKETNKNMIAGNIIPTPAQGDPNFRISQVINPATGLPRNEQEPYKSCPKWVGTEGTNGDSNMIFPSSYGTYHYCLSNFGIFTNDQYTFLTDNSSSPTTYYECPKSSATRFGLRIRHRYSYDKLSYGERGRAGQYRALFARSFGSSDIRMEPGKGGVANAISVNSTTPGGNGEMTKLGADCIDGNIDNCKSRFYSLGGVGGRSHLAETSYETVYVSPKEIKEYIDNPAKTPEVRYSINYTTDDPDLYYIGEDSEFQQVSFLSDLSVMIDDAEVLELIGKGGNGGYIKHNCWLQPQYFVYYSRGYSTSSSYEKQVPNVDADTTPIGLENYTFDEWEGYTNFNEAVIGNIEACKANGKNFREQFEETAGTNGYPGAIVIMW